MSSRSKNISKQVKNASPNEFSTFCMNLELIFSSNAVTGTPGEDMIYAPLVSPSPLFFFTPNVGNCSDQNFPLIFDIISGNRAHQGF
jgi:hypothetical protein